MALYIEPTGNALRAYENMVAKLRQRAAQELRLPQTEIVVRPIRPEDLGLTSGTADWYLPLNNSSGSAWNASDLTTTVTSGRWLGINGFGQSAANVHGVRITREGAVAREWDANLVRDFKHSAAWVDDPVTIDQNTNVTISLYISATGTITGFAPIGVAVEKKGLLIHP